MPKPETYVVEEVEYRIGTVPAIFEDKQQRVGREVVVSRGHLTDEVLDLLDGIAGDDASPPPLHRAPSSCADRLTPVAIPNFSGGFVGAGAVTILTEHISLRGEYRFTDFGSGSVGLPTINGMNLNDFVSARVAPTMQHTRVSLNYRF
jgi:hypothetical protein